MTNQDRVVLLLEKPSGETIAVVFASRAAADKVREASPFEVVGTVPVASRVDAMIP